MSDEYRPKPEIVQAVQSSAREHFGPLLTRFGYSYETDGPTYAAFRSETARFLVGLMPSIDSSKNWVWFEMHPVPNPDDEHFDVRDLLASAEPDLSSHERGVLTTRGHFKADSPEQTAASVAQLAALAGTHMGEFLAGTPALFSRLREDGEQRARQIELDSQLYWARERVAAAWPAKDYARVVEVFTPLEDFLAESEKLKLSYARKHMNGK